MPKKISFQLGDHVKIAGGVLQEYNVRLDGLTGVITSSRHDAPEGTFCGVCGLGKIGVL